DLILSRAENDPEGKLAAKLVEEVFVRESRIVELIANGEVIRTTPEHPFYVPGRGWVPTKDLSTHDRLLSHDGRLVSIDHIIDTEQIEPVYHLRVADFHTYFVGARAWGFSVWSHNACTNGKNGDQWELRDVNGNVLKAVTNVKGLEGFANSQGLKYNI